MNICLRKFQQGSSLIEVMIAFFVLAVGMLGVLAMQSTSVRMSSNAALYSQANLLAAEGIEAIRSSPTAGATFNLNYDDITPVAPDCTTVGTECDADDMADWSLAQWRAGVESTLPGGESQIVSVAAGVLRNVTVSIRFQIGYDDANQAITDEVQVDTVL